MNESTLPQAQILDTQPCQSYLRRDVGLLEYGIQLLCQRFEARIYVDTYAWSPMASLPNQRAKAAKASASGPGAEIHGYGRTVWLETGAPKTNSSVRGFF